MTTETRRRDLPGWILTPVVTLLLAPALAAALGMVLVFTDHLDDVVPACEAEPAANRCEEITLGMVGGHAVAFAALWMLLWVLPWWRGLRAARFVVAVLAGVVLLAAPLRLA